LGQIARVLMKAYVQQSNANENNRSEDNTLFCHCFHVPPNLNVLAGMLRQCETAMNSRFSKPAAVMGVELEVAQVFDTY